MSCTDNNIPQYLHYTADRKIYHNKDFKNSHSIYRLTKKGNPVEFPEGKQNAVSCKWSKLLKKKVHITQFETDENKQDYKFLFVRELRKTFVEKRFNENDDTYHTIKFQLFHKPEACNYPHTEILVHHVKYKNDEIILDKIITYEEWENKSVELKRKKSMFYKDLRKDIRDYLLGIFIEKHYDYKIVYYYFKTIDSVLN